MGKDVLHQFSDLAWFLTFTNNFWPGHIWGFVSVWWFFALIIQLYLLFPLFFCGITKYPRLTFGLIVTALTIAGVFYRFAGTEQGSQILLFATPLAHGAVFSLGIYLALGFGLTKEMFSILGTVFLMAQFAEPFFAVSFIAFVLWTLFLYQKQQERLKACKPLLWFGALSPFVFLIHGILREPFTAWVNAEQNALYDASGHYSAVLTLGVFVIWFAFVLLAALGAKKVFTSCRGLILVKRQ